MKCECGCGSVVKNRFVSGHNNRGKHFSEEHRRKIGESQNGNKNHWYGKHPSESTRMKMSAAHKGKPSPLKGKPLTEEHRRKLSESHKGRFVTKETRMKLHDANKGELNPMWGKRCSDEARRKTSERTRKLGASHPMRILAREHPEKLREICRRGGYAVAKKYGGWFGRHEIFRKRNPQKYHEQCRKGGLKGGLISIKCQRENYPYYIDDTPFDSNLERQAMLILCEKFNITPIEGVNCHIKVNAGEIDFRPEPALFVEFHPWDKKGLTHEQYYNRRRKLLDENGFQDCRLIVAKSLEEVEEVL